ncbi:hypothetical protein NST11_03515 [Caldifermentibacillus hisashii]|uniref:DNA-3-methyladenine glycosylase family protein n=1 Tax=Caldifermentibacillus hisashii TaxID=996558 RepID=UPI0031B7675C
MLYKKIGELFPKAPFDFEKTIRFLGGFPPTKKEQTLNENHLTKAILMNDQIFVFDLQSEGDIENPKLIYTIFSDKDISDKSLKMLEKKIDHFLSLSDDLKEFYTLASEDPWFQHINKKLYGYHQVKFLTPFESACWAIFTQKTPTNIAKEIKMRFCENFGQSLEINNQCYSAFPEPVNILRASEEEVAEMVKNKRKTQYLMSVCEAFSDVDEQFLTDGDYDEVEYWLKAIKGIGEWSASFILIRGIGRMERLPVSEKMLLKVFSETYKGDQDVKVIANHYGNWKGYWAHYLRALGAFTK